MYPVHAGSAFSLVDHRLDLLLAGVGGQLTADAGDAHLGAVPVLAVDVAARLPGSSPTSTVPATAHNTAPGQRGDPDRQLGS